MAGRPRVLYYEGLRFQPENLALLRAHFDVVALPSPEHDTDDVLAAVDVAFAPLGYHFGKERIDRASRLKVIASNTTGTPHIDVDYAEQRGVRVISLKHEGEFLRTITPTAEMTWGLLLAVMRRIPWAFDAVRGGQWDRRPFGGPAMLSRLGLGIVGLGRLGTMVARQGLAFGMRVRYFDSRKPPPADLALERAASLEALVEASDVVTLHVPFDATTERMIDGRLLARFKPGAYLVNTSRGELVDPVALLAALGSGRLAGAGLDVLDGEFDPAFGGRVAEHPLVRYARQHDNLVLTPHIGGSTVDAWRLTEEHTIRQVIAWLAR
ncbi:MAG: hydroxyacid dehydrogenase [Candidatus Rokubacteria bacterium]|nr:hydroxyacid dehydrogenase [Candidatus Rokubacteria bacterium]